MTYRARQGMFFQRGAVGEDYVTRVLPVPDYTAGDVQHLDDTRPHDVQLRPLLPSERTPRSSGRYPRGTRLLVFKPPLGLELRAIVFMPSRRRDNTVENVWLAIGEVARHNPDLGKLFEFAMTGHAVVVN